MPISSSGPTSNGSAVFSPPDAAARGPKQLPPYLLRPRILQPVTRVTGRGAADQLYETPPAGCALLRAKGFFLTLQRTLSLESEE